MADDQGWSSANMKKYMMKHQTIEPLDQEVRDSSLYPFVKTNHGCDGPIRTSFSSLVSPMEEAGLRAAEEVIGFHTTPTDPWNGEKLGFYHGQATVHRTGLDKGKRSYAARDYFLPVSHRPNLKVLTEATVARITLEDKTANGVDFFYNGNRHHLAATKEVIVCGGTIASPQMLELSGIGDPSVLEKVGIKCLVDLPSVGADLQDHIMTFVVQQLAPGVTSGDSLRHPEVMAAAQKAYMENQDGPLTHGFSTGGYFPATLFLEPEELDEIVRLLETGPFTSEYHRKQLAQTAEQYKSPKSANLYFTITAVTGNVKDGVSDQSELLAQPGPDEPDGVTWTTGLQYCASRGYVHVRSADVFEHPEINPRYLSHEADVIMLSAAMKFMDKLTRADALKGIVGTRTWPFGGCGSVRSGDQAEAGQRRRSWAIPPCGNLCDGSYSRFATKSQRC